MEIHIDGVAGMVRGESRTFDFPRRGRTAQGFLIRHAEGWSAFLNQCRHWPVPLDLGDGDFFHPGADRIVCKTHGAAYRLDDGFCEYGTCAGASLDAYPVAVAGDRATVTVPD